MQRRLRSSALCIAPVLTAIFVIFVLINEYEFSEILVQFRLHKVFNLEDFVVSTDEVAESPLLQNNTDLQLPVPTGKLPLELAKYENSTSRFKFVNVSNFGPYDSQCKLHLFNFCSF
jgi:hypothetical protein